MDGYGTLLLHEELVTIPKQRLDIMHTRGALTFSDNVRMATPDFVAIQR